MSPQAVRTYVSALNSDRIRALHRSLNRKKSAGGFPMRKIHLGFAMLMLIVLATIGLGQTDSSARYQLPPKEVIEAFDAQPLPAAILSPTRQVLALSYRRAYPTIAELSQPILRLAGARVNPNTNGPQRTTNIYGITLKKISDGSELKIM